MKGFKYQPLTSLYSHAQVLDIFEKIIFKRNTDSKELHTASQERKNTKTHEVCFGGQSYVSCTNIAIANRN